MNKICKRFEHLQKQLKRCKDSRNMLLDFATPQEFDSAVLEHMAELIDLLQRQKRFITRTNNTTNTNGGKKIAKDTKERFDVLYDYVRGQIMELVGGDIQSAYNYLVELVRHRHYAESTVWAVLDELILLVIPSKSYREEATA